MITMIKIYMYGVKIQRWSRVLFPKEDFDESNSRVEIICIYNTIIDQSKCTCQVYTFRSQHPVVTEKGLVTMGRGGACQFRISAYRSEGMKLVLRQ